MSISDYQNYTSAWAELIEFIKYEIKYMEKCTECYGNWHISSDWFAIMCNRPHCVVWAKVDGHSYWPGKAMTVNGNEVHVRFFGRKHTFADVPAKKCYLYSDESPDQRPPRKNQRRNSIDKPDYQMALYVSISN